MNNEEKILGLLEKVYIDLQETKKDLKETKKDIQETKKSLRTEMQQGFKELGNRLAHIENDHGQKLSALFDGYKLNSEKLDRIETEVSKHEEIILRRVR